MDNTSRPPPFVYVCVCVCARARLYACFILHIHVINARVKNLHIRMSLVWRNSPRQFPRHSVSLWEIKCLNAPTCAVDVYVCTCVCGYPWHMQVCEVFMCR